MPRRPIPERAPIGDPFVGVILQLSPQQQVLALNPEDNIQVVASGSFTVRYGARYLGKLHLSIIPGLIALDYGEMLTGKEAWDFLFKGSTLYPRAEVFGYRNDGLDDTMFVKQLDLAVPPEVLVYADPKATVPIARPTLLIAADVASLPPRLLEFLPRYPTLADWQASNE
jgi:hypothetical protein